ncbi:hypothetical protein Q9K01_10935 [Qipengyuania sp. DY56-A-20]|jgi:hypothetical protein|uniref:Uncharacterized protein n=1 Tax=Qipengyuania benthica TaxID=3067651 RepID=A0ABT9H9Z5_9SPHN|nr:hypothetical protein [Qipengyuania sp. DY56-A-20]MDP4540142.1 hypothetical protein [Qipengyuania sp. DY56-A-20]
MTATILQFPTRNKGRIRKSTGANSEGLFSMHQFKVEAGGSIEVFNLYREDEVSRDEFVAYFFQQVFNNLPKEAREAVRKSASCDAALGCTDRKRIAGALLASSFRTI